MVAGGDITKLSSAVPRTLDVFISAVQTNWLRLTGEDARFISTRAPSDRSVLLVAGDQDLKKIDRLCFRLQDEYHCSSLEGDKSAKVSERYAGTVRLVREGGLLAKWKWSETPKVKIPDDVRTRAHLEKGEKIIEARRATGLVLSAGTPVVLERYLIDHDGDGKTDGDLDATLYVISKPVGDILNDPRIPPDIPSLTLIRVDNAAQARLKLSILGALRLYLAADR